MVGSCSNELVGYVGGTNLYAYVGGRTLVYFDPLGLYRVDTQMDAFIPHDWLMVDPQSWVKGDNRDVSPTPLGLGSQRQLQTATVEMEACLQNDPEIAQFSDINYSHMYTINYIGGTDRHIKKKGTFTGSIEFIRTGPCDVQIKKRMHGKLPWPFGIIPAPAIDWEVVFDLHVREMASGGVRVYGTLTGKRDGFPGYEGYVMSRLIHSHDPRKTGDFLLSLFPPMEYTINSSFSLIDPNATLECCECKE